MSPSDPPRPAADPPAPRLVSPRAVRSSAYTPLRDNAHFRRMLADDIRERLRGACAHLPPEEFEGLVQQIAAFKLRWDPRWQDGA